MTKRKQDPGMNPAGAETTANTADTSPAKNKPTHEVRPGRVKAVVWANETEGGVRYNVTVRRIFKRNGSANWEQSDNFGRDDLPVVMEVVRQAWVWI